MGAASLWASLTTKAKETGSLGLLGVAIGAGIGSGLNILKANSQRGTFAVSVKADGSGGFDVDAIAGVLLGALGLMTPARFGGSLLLGAGVGMASGIVSRETAVLTHNHQLNQQALAIGNVAPQQSASGLRLQEGGLSSIAGYSTNHGPSHSYAQQGHG